MPASSFTSPTPTRSATGSSSLYKLDVQTGRVAMARLDGWMTGEPLFVPEPGAIAEDAGVLLAVASHLTREAAALFVLDATSMDVLAVAEAPVNVPLGFHGTFIH